MGRRGVSPPLRPPQISFRSWVPLPTSSRGSKGAQRGRQRSLGCKGGEGKGGRRSGEGGVWLSKVLNLETKLGWASREFPSSHGPAPSSCLTSLKHRRATIWGCVTLKSKRGPAEV